MTTAMKKFSILAVALLGLAACGIPVAGPILGLEPVLEPAAATSPNAGPGTAIVPPAQAAVFFNEGCLKTAPSFAGASGALGPLGFTQHSTLGTFYSNRGNLSIKTAPGSCSMVVGLNQSPASAQQEFETALNGLAGNNDASVEIDQINGPDGLTYLVARTAG